MGAKNASSSRVLSDMMMKVSVLALAILALYAAAEGSMPTVDMLPEDEELIQAKADEDIPELELAQSEMQGLTDEPEEEACLAPPCDTPGPKKVKFAKDSDFSKNAYSGREILGKLNRRSSEVESKYNSADASATPIDKPMTWKSRAPATYSVFDTVRRDRQAAKEAVYTKIFSGKRRL